MTVQTLDRTFSPEAETSYTGPSELQPLVHSLQSILKQIDDEYERERDHLIRTLPEASVKDRALAMLKSRHHARRENYASELAALLQGT
jgi:Mg2+/Co2+ transporter CorC